MDPQRRAASGSSFAPWRDPAARPHLRIVDVVKDFGDARAVDNISLDIFGAEFFALLGPSGCGKTTLLRMLAGFETPTSGRIELDGQDLTAVPPHERPVNMMFQSYALFPHMSVAKNIAFGLEMDRLPKAEVSRRVEEMLALVKLERFAGRKPQQLSGGQRQRVALARALAKKPKLLLLDEPLGALDKKLREETQFELVNIQESLGLTFVIVTHDQEEAMTVATRLAVMRDGKIAQLGEPREVYDAPASRYVAEFIGDVNILEGRLEDPEAGVIRIDGAAAPVQAGRPISGAKGAPVAVALRPEKLVIERRDDGPDPEANMLDGVVEDIAYLGDMSIFRVRLSGGGLARVARTNRVRLQSQTILWEDPVRLSWDAQAVVPLEG
ncbi:ABC transporter ATP-binding protein [Rubrimonas cliftonensis]|uniref:Spermidine/putrescine import ATP-binding protein PotA n=1 Tax=Rubrimonas cliftonensis TaxID=89524 RepID=A0A1H3VWT6_9RHOB|nr:polyamine ABC transporter ATP-binding protein [Rubrimonas cliftonensis]SDZ79239.1 putrescine transport system ATP-binding protein [Rubrimonas cliftonensis]